MNNECRASSYRAHQTKCIKCRMKKSSGKNCCHILSLMCICARLHLHGTSKSASLKGFFHSVFMWLTKGLIDTSQLFSLRSTFHAIAEPSSFNFCIFLLLFNKNITDLSAADISRKLFKIKKHLLQEFLFFGLHSELWMIYKGEKEDCQCRWYYFLFVCFETRMSSEIGTISISSARLRIRFWEMSHRFVCFARCAIDGIGRMQQVYISYDIFLRQI